MNDKSQRQKVTCRNLGGYGDWGPSAHKAQLERSVLRQRGEAGRFLRRHAAFPAVSDPTSTSPKQ